MERYLAINHILLMIWKYFMEIIEEIEKNSTEKMKSNSQNRKKVKDSKESPENLKSITGEEKQGNTGEED